MERCNRGPRFVPLVGIVLLSLVFLGFDWGNDGVGGPSSRREAVGRRLDPGDSINIPFSPKLAVNPHTVYLGKSPAGKAFHNKFTAKNTGIRTLTGTISINVPWINALSHSSFRLTPGQQVSIGFLGLFPSHPGEFRGSISVYSNGGNKTVKLRGIVEEPPPELSVTPQTVYLGKRPAGRAFYNTFTAKNTGIRTLTGTVSINVPWINALSHSSFRLTPGQQVSIGFLGLFPSHPGEFRGGITVYSNGGNTTVRLRGVVQEKPVCTFEMPDWLRSRMCPPWISHKLWYHLPQEDRDVILDWLLRVWNRWIHELTEEGRSCEADLEEYLILAQGFRPLLVVEKCWWNRGHYADTSISSRRFGYPTYLDRVMWTGASRENEGFTWYEVIHNGQLGWMRSTNFGDRLHFDMSEALVAIPQDGEIAEALHQGLSAAQYIDISSIARPEDEDFYGERTAEQCQRYNCNLCGEFCVAALLGEQIDFQVLNLLRDWTKEDSGAYYILKHDLGTDFEDLEDMLDLYDVDYQRLDRHLTSWQLEYELDSGKMMIAFVTINSCGVLGGTIYHWVVVEDAKAGGAGGWVRIYNPFGNQEEIYTYEDFLAQWRSTSAGFTGLWVMLDTRFSVEARDAEGRIHPHVEPMGAEEAVQATDGIHVLRPSSDEKEVFDTAYSPSQGEYGGTDENIVTHYFNPTPTTITFRTEIEDRGKESSAAQSDAEQASGESVFSDGIPTLGISSTAPFNSDDVREEYVSEEGKPVGTSGQLAMTGDGQEQYIPPSAQLAINEVSDDRDWNPLQPTWFDLGEEVSVNGIRFVVKKTSDGQIPYQVWVAGNSGSWSLVYEFDDYTQDGNVLEKQFSPPLNNVRYVEIRTFGHPNWLSDVEIF